MSKIHQPIEDFPLITTIRGGKTHNPFSSALFANLPDACRTNWFDKVKFGSVEAIPTCRKYQAPTSIQFLIAEEQFCEWKMVKLSLDIERIIKSDEKHFLTLHPVRYDKVKEAIARGEIDMPIIYQGSDDIPSVQDGRHRIVALYKFGFSQLDVSVPEVQADIIQTYYNPI